MELSILSISELRARPGRKWHHYGEDVLPAWIAEMDFPVAEPIQEALRRSVQEASYGYEGGTLYPALAEAFASHMQEQFGWQPGTAHVLPVADLVQALFAAVTVFTERGQGVILQMPIYPPFQAAVRETGRRIVEHPLIDNGGRYEIDVANMPADGAPLLLLCNPHNPSGRVFERPELEAIAQYVLRNKSVVVADEIHADLIYRGHTHIPFASLSPEVAERTITITSATKAFNIPGLRCGLMHFGSAELRERFRDAIPDRMLGIVNQFGIKATIAAWKDCGPWLASVMDVLDENRQHLTRFLRTDLPDIGYYEPEATYLAWLDCRRLELATPQQFFLDNARVAMNDGGDFGGPSCVRLNFGTSPVILDEILGRVRDAVLHHPRRNLTP